MAFVRSAAVVLLGVFLTAVTLVTGSLRSTSIVGAASAQAAPAELPPVDYSMYDAEMQEALRWFDALGYPDVRGKPYVRVNAGTYEINGEEQTDYRYGFLLEETEEEFRVLGPTLDVTRYVKREWRETDGFSARVGAWEATHEPEDFKARARRYLRATRKHGEDSGSDEWRHTPFEFGRLGRARLFMQAWVCARLELPELAQEFFAQAKSVAGQWSDMPERETLLEYLKDEVGEWAMWRAVLDFEDLSVSWRDLLERFEWFVEKFPESEHTERAQETADLLRDMVAEDEEHARKARPLDEMTEEERIAELIFQLRDQNGYQMGQPGACDIFLDRRGEESPAHQLVAIGYAAVPQLIEVLKDQRFTRSVGYHRDFYFSHYVLRVGDAALAVTERISGRHFYERGSTSGAMVKDGDAPSTRQRVEAWWAEFQQKGERQALIEAVASGDDNSAEQARLLIDRYPGDALSAIAKGWRHLRATTGCEGSWSASRGAWKGRM